MAQQAQQFNRSPSKSKKPRFAHTDNTKYGMGDHYGTGIKAKVGTIRDEMGMQKLTNKMLGKPPRGLA